MDMPLRHKDTNKHKGLKMPDVKSWCLCG